MQIISGVFYRSTYRMYCERIWTGAPMAGDHSVILPVPGKPGEATTRVESVQHTMGRLGEAMEPVSVYELYDTLFEAGDSPTPLERADGMRNRGWSIRWCRVAGQHGEDVEGFEPDLPLYADWTIYPRPIQHNDFGPYCQDVLRRWGQQFGVRPYGELLADSVESSDGRRLSMLMDFWLNKTPIEHAAAQLHYVKYEASAPDSPA